MKSTDGVELAKSGGQMVTRLDPQALILKAVESNAGIETLERLVALAKDVREVQAREAWHEAMAEFHRLCPPIHKTKRAKITTRSGGSFGYSFAPLNEIMDTIRPIMGTLGLSVSWSSSVEPTRVSVTCRIAHALGYSETSGEVAMPIGDATDGTGANPAQKVGIALTYARRYSLLSIAGLSPDEDSDGAEPKPPSQAPKSNAEAAKSESPLDLTLEAEARAREEAESKQDGRSAPIVDRPKVWTSVLARAKKQNVTAQAVLLDLTGKSSMPSLTDAEVADLATKLEG